MKDLKMENLVGKTIYAVVKFGDSKSYTVEPYNVIKAVDKLEDSKYANGYLIAVSNLVQRGKNLVDVLGFCDTFQHDRVKDVMLGTIPFFIYPTAAYDYAKYLNDLEGIDTPKDYINRRRIEEFCHKETEFDFSYLYSDFGFMQKFRPDFKDNLFEFAEIKFVTHMQEDYSMILNFYMYSNDEEMTEDSMKFSIDFYGDFIHHTRFNSILFLRYMNMYFMGDVVPKSFRDIRYTFDETIVKIERALVETIITSERIESEQKI